MSELPPEIKQLLRTARQGLSPTDVQRAAIEKRLVEEFWSKPVAASSLPNAISNHLPWIYALIGGLAVGGAVGFHWGRPAQQPFVDDLPPTAIAISSGAPEVGSQLPLFDSAEVANQTPSPHRSASRSTERNLKPKVEQVEEDEVLLVQRAQRAIGRGEAAVALALFQQADENVAQGRLLEERYAGKAIARCMLTPAAGHEQLHAFSRRYPRSVHAARVAQVCTAGSADPQQSRTKHDGHGN